MTTAREIRKQCDKDIKALQNSCQHPKSEWMAHEITIGHTVGSVRVCKICDKMLEHE